MREDANPFEVAWAAMKKALTDIGKAVAAHNLKAVETLLHKSIPVPTERLMIESFENATIGYARSVLREQLLRARAILDDPRTRALPVADQRQLVKESFDAYENRMHRIANNELLRLNADINKGRQMLAGIRNYVWTTCLDDRVRPRHNQLEGQVCTWIAAPDPGYHPGEDYMCRCTAFPVLDDSYLLVRNQGLDV